MTLFDTKLDGAPTVSGGHSISLYERYCDSSNLFILPYRARAEEMFARYPDEHKPALRSRIMSDDDQFLSAAFELIVHDCLLKSGWQIEVEPTLDNGSGKKPDFYITDQNKGKVYVEVKTLFQETLSRPEENRLNDLLAKLSSFDLSDLSIWSVTPNSIGANQISAKLLIKYLRLADDSKNTPHRATENGFEFEVDNDRLVVKGDGWHLSFDRLGRPAVGNGIAKSNQFPIRMDGHLTTFNGQPGDYTRSKNNRCQIRDALKSKAKHYGQLDAPLCIAFNHLARFSMQSRMESALFGDKYIRFWGGTSNGMRICERRQSNGIWTEDRKGKQSLAAAVWYFQNTTLHSSHDSNGTLYMNPNNAESQALLEIFARSARVPILRHNEIDLARP